MQHVKIFGSAEFTHIPKQFVKKFDPIANKVVLVGYHKNSTNYRVYITITEKVTVSRNVVLSGNSHPKMPKKIKMSLPIAEETEEA